MANYITIDGGTTNTRISLVQDGSMTDTLKFGVGARAGMEEEGFLQATVKQGIQELLTKNGMESKDITRILASGMITSEFGLYQLDHATVPVGIAQLHQAMEEVMLEEISPIPFVFMRGVKTACNSLADADMMRGEETELMGILEEGDGEGVYILPGSHSKIIRLDAEGKILEFSTMLTGEMAAALSQHTILKDAVSFDQSQIEKDYLLQGYTYGTQKGVNEALFKARVLKNILKGNSSQVYSFFLGVILCGEINRVLDFQPSKIVIGGKKQLREAMGILLEASTNSRVVCLSDETVDLSSAMGMIKIYEHKE